MNQNLSSTANYLKQVIRFSTFGYERYIFIVAWNYVKKWFLPKKSHKFLFILSPPYNGSTLLHELLSTSTNTSSNNNYATREGQTLPTVKKIMFDHTHRWDPTVKFDWSQIKSEWMKYWDQTRSILIEKSPPNIIRSEAIQKTFRPCFFIIFYRNPYAYCESAMRREGQTPRSAALFAINCLKIQKENIDKLNNSLSLSYELLTDHTQETIDSICNFIPELKDIKIKTQFKAHNYHAQSMGIENNNLIKTTKINPLHLKEINSIFRSNVELLDFFGYEIYEK